MIDLKTSLLVNRQVPEFVRNEHPKFILFLEAYYEFLDQGGYGKAKELRNISDVDISLGEFEQQFFNTFLPFIPRNVSVSKETLIKNVLPLYLSKGSEKSFRLLFRLLFDQEIAIETPGKQILRASDGRWLQENVLRTDTNIYTEYIANGLTNTYYLPYVMDKSEFEITIDDVNIDAFEFRKETRKIIFDVIPNVNQIIKIRYVNFNASILNNLKITGKISGSSAIVEKASRTNVGGLNFYQLFINSKTFFGNFIRSEIIEAKIIINNVVIPIYVKSFSGLLRIDVLNGGSNYNIGDPVIVRGPSEIPAVAVVDDIVTGTIDDIFVLTGGTGYQVNNQIFVENIDSSFFTAQISVVDDSASNTTNTLTYNLDVINDFANVSIDSADYGFPATGSENVNTIISEALTSNVISNLGPVTLVTVLNSSVSTSDNPNFITKTAQITDDLTISDLGCIGKIDIVDGGQDYQVGDELVFTNTKYFSGQGASGIVTIVDNNGSIVRVSITNPGLSYQQQFLPQVTVNSLTGNGANLIASSLLGTGATYQPIIEEGLPGQIKTIKVVTQGSGYEIVPGIDLSFSGDGTATANATLTESFLKLKGKWTTSDSILSDDQIKLQGRDYYIPYSYVISSQVEFNKYKDLLKKLLHPSGLINYSKYRIFETVDVNLTSNVVSSLIKTVSGTVNIANNSSIVIGTNTEFTIANTLGILSENSIIVINDEIRSVISIDDSSTFTVNTDFTSTSNNELVKILS